MTVLCEVEPANHRRAIASGQLTGRGRHDIVIRLPISTHDRSVTTAGVGGSARDRRAISRTMGEQRRRAARHLRGTSGDPHPDGGSELRDPTDVDVLMNPWADPAFVWLAGELSRSGVPALREMLLAGAELVGQRDVVVDAVALRCATPDCWEAVLDLVAGRAPDARTTLLTRASTRRRVTGVLRGRPVRPELPVRLSLPVPRRRRPLWRHLP
jgi:hypothetical protein